MPKIGYSWLYLVITGYTCLTASHALVMLHIQKQAGGFPVTLFAKSGRCTGCSYTYTHVIDVVL